MTVTDIETTRPTLDPATNAPATSNKKRKKKKASKKQVENPTVDHIIESLERVEISEHKLVNNETGQEYEKTTIFKYKPEGNGPTSHEVALDEAEEWENVNEFKVCL